MSSADSIRVLGISLAVASPYVLDFFSLARGYGLALALVAVSALFTFDFAEQPTIATALAAVTSAAFAVLANYAALDFFLAVILVVVLALVVPVRAGERSIAIGPLIAAVILPTVGVALLAGIPLRRLRSEGELYFGGHVGFWQDTVRSLISSTLYHRGWDLLDITLVVLAALMVAGGAVAAAIALRRRSLPPHATAFILLAVPAIASIVQHYVFGSPFLIERTALFFVPLFAIWLALAADALARHPRYTAGVTAGAAVIATAACINLATAANLSYVLDWRYDATTEQAIRELAGPRSERRPVDFGVSFLVQPTTTFYRETRFRWLPECPSDCLDTRSEYYYVIGPDVATVRERGARVIRVYPLSGGVLARDAHAQTLSEATTLRSTLRRDRDARQAAKPSRGVLDPQAVPPCSRFGSCRQPDDRRRVARSIRGAHRGRGDGTTGSQGDRGIDDLLPRATLGVARLRVGRTALERIRPTVRAGERPARHAEPSRSSRTARCRAVQDPRASSSGVATRGPSDVPARQADGFGPVRARHAARSGRASARATCSPA